MKIAILVLSMAVMAFGQTPQTTTIVPEQATISQGVITPGQLAITRSGTVTSGASLIMTCDSDGDAYHVKNCKLAKGHTLDEAMNEMLRAMKEEQKYQDERYNKLLDFATQYVNSVKKDLAAIQEALHPKPIVKSAK